MCIRATDYLPPVDPTFSDFLRAMVTADFELNRADDSGLRASMIEAFRQRGIRPEAVGSLAVQSLLLEAEDLSLSQPDEELGKIVSRLLEYGARQLGRNYFPGRNRRPGGDYKPADNSKPGGNYPGERKRRSPRKLEKPSEWITQQNPYMITQQDEEVEQVVTITPEDEPEDVLREIAPLLTGWAKANRARLRLHPDFPVALRGFHPVHRIAATGELLVEMVAHFVQTQKIPDELGGLKYRSGV
jgi:hypothetical protein